MEETELILIGRVENLDDLLVDLGWRVGSLSSSYLRLPLGKPFKCTVTRDGVEEWFTRGNLGWSRRAVHKRLFMWN